MIKTIGLEYKAFVNAEWDTLLGVKNAYMDDTKVLINGDDEPIDIDEIPDDAKVEIHSGCIYGDTAIDMSLMTAFKKWKKTQTHTTFVVQVPNSELNYFKGQVSIFKGKIL